MCLKNRASSIRKATSAGRDASDENDGREQEIDVEQLPFSNKDQYFKFEQELDQRQDCQIVSASSEF